MRKLLFVVVACALSLAAAQWRRSDSCPAADGQHIYIVTTNDIHSALDNVPRLASLVKQYRAKGDVLLVDSGDRCSGHTFVDDAPMPGASIVSLMNRLGYDAATLGNHEFDYGMEHLADLFDLYDFEIVCANLAADDAARFGKLSAGCVFERGGVKIAFAGVVDTEMINEGRITPAGKSAAFRGAKFSPARETAARVVDSLARDNDFVVLLSHMGNKTDSLLALSSPSCRWIASGHSHDRRATDVGGIHISQNAKSLRYVTVADLTVRGGRIVSVDYEQLPVSEFEPDPEYVEAVARIRAAMPEMFDTVGRAEYEATKDGVANLFVEALAGHDYDGFRPEVTVYHFGGVRIGGIPAGDIPRWLIYDSDIFRSTVFIGEMTRSELECLVKTKYNSQGADGGKDKESHYVYLRSDVPYRIDTLPGGDAERVVFPTLDDGRKYRVAMCNYVAEEYVDNYEGLKGVVDMRNTGIPVRDLLLERLAASADGYRPDNRIKQYEASSEAGNS